MSTEIIDFDNDKESIDVKPNQFKENLIADVEHQFNKMGHLDKIITGDILMKTIVSEASFLADPLLRRKGLACVAGASDTGKSRLLRQFAIAVVTGQEFLGIKLNTRSQSCIYVSTEDDDQSTAALLQKQAAGCTEEEVKRLRFIFDTDNLLHVLEESLMQEPADLVIIDCFSDIFGSDLKDSQKIRACLHQFHLLAQKHDCLFLFLHHTGKRTEDSAPSKNHLLSGQGLEAKMRLVIEFRLDHVDPNLRHICIVKANHLPPNYKTESYVVRFDEATHSFVNTGERMPFELLAKNSVNDIEEAKYEQIMLLKKQSKTYEEIAKAIGYESKGSVTKLIARVEKRRIL